MENVSRVGAPDTDGDSDTVEMVESADLNESVDMEESVDMDSSDDADMDNNEPDVLEAEAEYEEPDTETEVEALPQFTWEFTEPIVLHDQNHTTYPARHWTTASAGGALFVVRTERNLLLCFRSLDGGISWEFYTISYEDESFVPYPPNYGLHVLALDENELWVFFGHQGRRYRLQEDEFVAAGPYHDFSQDLWVSAPIAGVDQVGADGIAVVYYEPLENRLKIMFSPDRGETWLGPAVVGGDRASAASGSLCREADSDYPVPVPHENATLYTTSDGHLLLATYESFRCQNPEMFCYRTHIRVGDAWDQWRPGVIVGESCNATDATPAALIAEGGTTLAMDESGPDLVIMLSHERWFGINAGNGEGCFGDALPSLYWAFVPMDDILAGNDINTTFHGTMRAEPDVTNLEWFSAACSDSACGWGGIRYDQKFTCGELTCSALDIVGGTLTREGMQYQGFLKQYADGELGRNMRLKTINNMYAHWTATRLHNGEHAGFNMFFQEEDAYRYSNNLIQFRVGFSNPGEGFINMPWVGQGSLPAMSMRYNARIVSTGEQTTGVVWSDNSNYLYSEIGEHPDYLIDPLSEEYFQYIRSRISTLVPMRDGGVTRVSLGESPEPCDIITDAYCSANRSIYISTAALGSDGTEGFDRWRRIYTIEQGSLTKPQALELPDGQICALWRKHYRDYPSENEPALCKYALWNPDTGEFTAAADFMPPDDPEIDDCPHAIVHGPDGLHALYWKPTERSVTHYRIRLPDQWDAKSIIEGRGEYLPMVADEHGLSLAAMAPVGDGGARVLHSEDGGLTWRTLGNFPCQNLAERRTCADIRMFAGPEGLRMLTTLVIDDRALNAEDRTIALGSVDPTGQDTSEIELQTIMTSHIPDEGNWSLWLQDVGYLDDVLYVVFGAKADVPEQYYVLGSSYLYTMEGTPVPLEHP